MKGIHTYTQKDEKKSKKNTASGVKKPKKVIPKYETTKRKDVESLRDPALYPKENRSRLEDKFLNEYNGFMRFFLNTYNFLPNEKLDDFLSNYPFQTFQKNVHIRQKGNRRRKTLNQSDLDKTFELKWNIFLEMFEDMLDDLPSELSQLATEMIRPELSHFKRLLDYERRKEGKSRLRDSYLTQEGLAKF